MTDAKHNIKQISIQDVQENFEQVLDDVLVSGEPVKITSDNDNAILGLKKFGAE